VPFANITVTSPISDMRFDVRAPTPPLSGL
jgi:hypothetical protein